MNNMKKVGIVTIYDTNNYGNRLQNYAMQEVLSKMGVEVETLRNYANTNKEDNRIIHTLKRIKNGLQRVKKIGNKRAKCFQEFDRNIEFASKELRWDNAGQFVKNYDYFVTGSDQVWNPYFDRLSKIDLLEFAPPEKRISIAASFGVEKLEAKYEKECQKALNEFHAISVREQQGKQIIQQMEGISKEKEIEVVLDPTMMLTEKQWEKVMKKPKDMPQGKYILNYFLGELEEETKQYIEKIAKENNCQIIQLLDLKEKLHNTGPSEFLYLLQHAFLICTDSFHSCVFSILFQKPFIIVERKSKKNMNSRIDTLLDTFSLQDRKLKTNDIQDMKSIDYQKVFEVLEKEKMKETEWIKKALNIK